MSMAQTTSLWHNTLSTQGCHFSSGPLLRQLPRPRLHHQTPPSRTHASIELVIRALQSTSCKAILREPTRCFQTTRPTEIRVWVTNEQIFPVVEEELDAKLNCADICHLSWGFFRQQSLGETWSTSWARAPDPGLTRSLARLSLY